MALTRTLCVRATLALCTACVLACDTSPRTDRAERTDSPRTTVAAPPDTRSSRDSRDLAGEPDATAARGRTTAERATQLAQREPCRVAAVTDGDSMRCTDERRIRLLLLDAPEMSQTPFGARARDALRARVRRGDTVWLEYDVQREDRYNRTLAHVWTAANGGTHINLAQAHDGWALAVVFPPNVRYIEHIRDAVADARRNKRGLWADGSFSCTPVDHKQGKC